MNIASVDQSALPLLSQRAPSAAHLSPAFNHLLSKAHRDGQSLANAGTDSPIDRGAEPAGLREAVTRFVATTLIAPLLKQFAAEPFKSDLFHGGFAEDAFRQQLDTVLADRIAASPKLPIVDHLYQSFSRNLITASGPAKVDLHG
jgi:hypothetical protein